MTHTINTASPLRLALVGFGVVGQGFAELLHEQAAALRADYGFEAHVVGVATARRGSLYDPAGLSVPALIAAAQTGDLAAYPSSPTLRRGLDALSIIARPEADVVVEVSPTDLRSGEPATTHARAALAAGKHLITANKGPIALHFAALRDEARAKRLFLGYEAVVMGGTPAIRLAESGLAGGQITAIRGILNSTTNYMLSRMAKGDSYADALAEAQRLGYAETDPSGDVEGHDAAGKLAILCTILMGVPLRPDQVDRVGITGLTADDMRAAGPDRRWRLVAQAVRTSPGAVQARVRPELLPASDPLSAVDGVTNAITYESAILGPVTLIGAGAGGRKTGYALLTDLLALHRLRV